MLTAVRGYRQYHKRQFEQAAALLPAIQMPGRPLGMLEREFGICHTALQIELRPCGGDAVLHSLDRIERDQRDGFVTLAQAQTDSGYSA